MLNKTERVESVQLILGIAAKTKKIVMYLSLAMTTVSCFLKKSLCFVLFCFRVFLPKPQRCTFGDSTC